MRHNFLSFRELPKEQLEANLSGRLVLIRAALNQAKKDSGYFEHPFADQFVDRHLFVALVEKALLVAEETNKNDPRDTRAFGFHLWVLKKEFARQNISKPIESITALLEKSGAIKEIAQQWSVGTVRNKVSRVQEMVNLSKKKGACHEPRLIGDCPKVESFRFIQSITNGCVNCTVIWKDLLKVNSSKDIPFELAAKALAKEYPELSKPLSAYMKYVRDMNLGEILERSPQELRGTLAIVTG